MKYQQLENLESGWIWSYLVKKHRDGENITKHIEKSTAEEAIIQLFAIQQQPIKIKKWIQQHMASELDIKLKQTIRARRKRYFNAEHQHMRKKSIDLDFAVWQRLSNLAVSQEVTLSEMIIKLIEDAERKAHFAEQMSSLKQGLQQILMQDK